MCPRSDHPSPSSLGSAACYRRDARTQEGKLPRYFLMSPSMTFLRFLPKSGKTN